MIFFSQRNIQHDFKQLSLVGGGHGECINQLLQLHLVSETGRCTTPQSHARCAMGLRDGLRICANTCVMAFQSEYSGLKTGYEQGDRWLGGLGRPAVAVAHAEPKKSLAFVFAFSLWAFSFGQLRRWFSGWKHCRPGCISCWCKGIALKAISDEQVRF